LDAIKSPQSQGILRCLGAFARSGWRFYENNAIVVELFSELMPLLKHW
jgi:hypothetical protein